MRRQASHPIPVVVIPLTNRGSLVRIAPRPLSLLPPSSLFRTENRSCCFYSHHSPPSRLLRGFSWTTAPSLRPPLRRRLRVSRPGRGAFFSACLPSAAAVMSVAGLKKQFHKATQKVSEKVGGAEGTKLDDDFREMEKKVDVTSRAVLDIMTKTTEYLQPNPASRAKLSMINTMSKIRGQEKGPGYPQAETVLGDTMLKFGRELGEDSSFGSALIEASEAMKELGEVKDALDMEVKQNFIDPLQNLHDKDLKEIQHHLKKMEGRRLDFDYKKKRQGKVQDEEIKQALEKFDESKEIAEQSMFNLLESDIEQVSQLAALVQAQLEYHRRSAEILQQLSSKMEDRIKEASCKPRKEFTPKARLTLELLPPSESHNGGLHSARSPGRSPAPLDQPCCRALYDFEPENEGELGFKEGDVITLTNQIDDNWYEGMIHGHSGFFPINYVDILVPLPR